MLACPRCKHAPLDIEAGDYRCGSCRTAFPRIGGIPWLFPEPGVALGEWRGRLDFAIKTVNHEHEQLRSAQRSPTINDLTRRRLELLAAAKNAYAEQLTALLAPLEIQSLTADYDSGLAFRTRMPADQNLMTYAYNVYRDWSWGEEENEASFAIVRDALGDTRPNRTLILGAGAGRLAYDFHMRTESSATVVLDFNPYLMLLARRITEGESIELYEFPASPKTLDDHAVLRTLSAEEACREGLHYILADAHHPPFAAGSFDTIVTPWLVDILPERFDSLCNKINRLLADDGVWINFGTLSFHVGDPALQHGREECEAIIAASGFAEGEFKETTIPYLCSPASRHGRHEQLLSWRAVKKDGVDDTPAYQALPDWLIEGTEPVPQLETFQSTAVSMRLRAYIMSLIDGQRSLDDMADAFVQQNIMPHAEAKASIRTFLIKLYESSQRR